MKEPPSDELLWELPRAEVRDDAPAPPDAVLLAYRAGGLTPADGSRLEWSLSGSRRGRARLAELAGIRLEAPARAGAGRPRVRRTALAAAAAILLVALVLWKRDELLLPTPLPLPEYTLRVEGLATTRAVPGGASALPDGMVRVVLEPRGDAVAGVRFAAYRLDGHELTRLAEPGEIAVESERGSAVLTAVAERLVGAAPGTRTFFVVVAGRAELPARMSLASEVPEAALERVSGGRVYVVPLTIVAATDGAP